MYVCGNEECNTMREPVCSRGGPVTAASVQGTGPGSSCPKPKTPATPVVPPKLTSCVINFTGQAKALRTLSNGRSAWQGC